MPKRTDIKSILVLGAGPIIIGQACEFDYSGAQACKALKAEGYQVVLVNSNPATIMTDPELAHRTYIEPITAEWVEKVIEREKPDALLPTMGGQTALNIAMDLHRSGALERLDIVRSGAVVRSVPVEGYREARLEETVRDLEGGEYVYVRAVQTDGGAAWSSPFFVIPERGTSFP